MEFVSNQPVGSIIRDGDFRQKALKREQRAFGDLNVKKLGWILLERSGLCQCGMTRGR